MPPDRAPSRSSSSWAASAPATLAVVACLLPKCPICWAAMWGLSSLLAATDAWHIREIFFYSAELALLASTVRMFNGHKWIAFSIGLSGCAGAGLWLLFSYPSFYLGQGLLLLAAAVGMKRVAVGSNRRPHCPCQSATQAPAAHCSSS